MMNRAIEDALLEELQREDAALMEAQDALEQARVRYEIALERYMAVRSIVRKRMDGDPYTLGPLPSDSYASRGRIRFKGLNPGEAAIDVLKGAKTPLTLHQIAGQLRSGGLDTSDLRRINAALLNTSGITKSGDTYIYENPLDLAVGEIQRMINKEGNRQK